MFIGSSWISHSLRLFGGLGRYEDGLIHTTNILLLRLSRCLVRKSLLFAQIIGVIVLNIWLINTLVEVAPLRDGLDWLVHKIVDFLHLFYNFLLFCLLRRQKEANDLRARIWHRKDFPLFWLANQKIRTHILFHVFVLFWVAKDIVRYVDGSVLANKIHIFQIC